jgi:transcriptional regulator with GAF, ATPase, and Fis domain
MGEGYKRQPLTEDAALWAMAEGVEAETGARFFPSPTGHLALALACPYAFVSDCPATAGAFGPARSGAAADSSRTSSSHILDALKRTNWRIDGPKGAARSLNLNPSTLRSRMKKLGIRRSASEL